MLDPVGLLGPPQPLSMTAAEVIVLPVAHPFRMETVLLCAFTQEEQNESDGIFHELNEHFLGNRS